METKKRRKKVKKGIILPPVERINNKKMRFGKRKNAKKTPPPYLRPQTRGECIDGPRPCPYVGCRYHLFLDVYRAGGLQLNFGTENVDILKKVDHTCALDVADARTCSSEMVSKHLNVSVQAIKFTTAIAQKKVKRYLEIRELYDDEA
jgi:hypothetical protein